MILKDIGPVDYRSSLPLSFLGVHPSFHVLMLKKYHGNGDYTTNWDLYFFELSYEEESIIFY